MARGADDYASPSSGVASKKALIAGIASARPRRCTSTSAGKALVRRVGRRLSSITNTPRSVRLRTSRPKACLSFIRVALSVQASRPCHVALALNNMSGRGQGTRSYSIMRSASPARSTVGDDEIEFTCKVA